MASAGLLALIDDVAALLDDIAILSKVAAKKTAGVLGDDLALNAEQVSGVRAERELPVVWAVAKGSAKNKLILVPAALLISAFIPWLIMPLLMVGGGFLCFEGAEKIAHKLWGSHEVKQNKREAKLISLAKGNVDLVALEKDKIKGAIRTDFILSAEIVVIVLGTVAEQTFMMQVIVVSLMAALITAGVYGVVAAIVKLDDAGLYLMQSKKAGTVGDFSRWFGLFILNACPYLMKGLSIVGTAAMFLVGGGILVHGIPSAHHLVESASHLISTVPAVGHLLLMILPSLINALAGILAGLLFFLLINL